MLGLAAQCHTQLAQAALDGACAWRGERKHLRRALAATAPVLADRLADALRAAFQGDRTQLLSVGRQVLDGLGGYQRAYVEHYRPRVKTTRSSASSKLVSVDGPLSGQGKVCELVLRALPQWFGIESATLNYIRSADELPSFVAYLAGEPVGIALLERHEQNPCLMLIKRLD